MKIESVKSTSTIQVPQYPGEYQRYADLGKKEYPFQNQDVALSDERILYNRLERANLETHAVAQKIRSIDETFNRIENNVRHMHKLLDGIVKNFPPFPNNSSERIQSLRQFSALRKMIDQLTMPPPDESPGMILGNSSIHAQAGDWELKPSDGESVTLSLRPLHTGAEGLNIPDLASDATDAQVGDALVKTSQAQTAIGLKRRAFVEYANRVIAALG
jgi:hypothetical protein